jgi:hypothetical protein
MRTDVTRVAILFRKPLTPFANYSSLNPLLNMMFELWFANSEKLCAVVDRCIANATCCKATAWASPFVQNDNVMSAVAQLLCCYEASKTSANNYYAHN